MNDFCVFILSHGRPNKVITIETLKKHGYTGRVYIIIDNEDKTADQYYDNYKDIVIMFDKEAISKTFDEGDNFEDRRTITYARNACFEIAKKLGITCFIQLDDDYIDFRYKIDSSGNNINKLDIKNLDYIFMCLLKYYKSISACAIAIAQGGDFLGGKDGNAAKNPQFRKCMNSFICSTERPFQFSGRFNEDVNTYTEQGRRGALFLTIPMIALQQKTTQKTSGGISELYNKYGTFVKAFTTVMYSPSCVKVKMMLSRHPRIHHSVSWNNAVPVIIREIHKKK